MEQASINIVAFNQLKEDFDEILPALVEAFIEDGDDLLSQIENNLNNMQTDEGKDSIRQAAHTLKSSARNMGADPLADYCQVIESNTQPSNDIDHLLISDLYEKAYAEMQSVKPFLAENML